jgi:hypothetical protein
MKVKVTATISYETELGPELYDSVENAPETDDEIIAWELKQAANIADVDADTTLYDAVMMSGEISDFKIEKIEEASPAQSEAA